MGGEPCQHLMQKVGNWVMRGQWEVVGVQVNVKA